jgi:hypothetical protein
MGCHLYIKMMFQFCRLHFLHNFIVKKTQVKLDLKDNDLFGHQIKNTRRIKLLHLKYFTGFLHFYLLWEISLNFWKWVFPLRIRNLLIISSKLEVLMSSFDLRWRYCLKVGDSRVKLETWLKNKMCFSKNFHFMQKLFL